MSTSLLVYATEGLLTVPGLHLIGTAKEKAGVLSFVLDECRSEDVGKALDARKASRCAPATIAPSRFCAATG